MNPAAQIRLAATFLAAATIHAYAADPLVSNGITTQRLRTKFVDAAYELIADMPKLKVFSLNFNDGSTTCNGPAKRLKDDVGAKMTVGQGEGILWNAPAGWAANSSGTTSFSNYGFRLARSPVQQAGN